MKLSLASAIALALVANLLPGCKGPAGGDPGKSSSGASSGQTPKGGATGQASEGSTDDRNAPARPSSSPAR